MLAHRGQEFNLIDWEIIGSDLVFICSFDDIDRVADLMNERFQISERYFFRIVDEVWVDMSGHK